MDDAEYRRWLSEYQRLGRAPSLDATNRKERQAAKWHGRMQQALDDGTIDLTDAVTLSQTPGWKWTDRVVWESARQAWMAEYKRLGQEPTKDVYEYGARVAAMWAKEVRAFKQSGRMTPLHDHVWTNTPGWRWMLPDDFEAGRERWMLHYRRLGRDPKSSGIVDPDEQRSATWQANMRTAYKGFMGHAIQTSHTITAEQVRILEETPGWRW